MFSFQVINGQDCKVCFQVHLTVILEKKWQGYKRNEKERKQSLVAKYQVFVFVIDLQLSDKNLTWVWKMVSQAIEVLAVKNFPRCV